MIDATARLVFTGGMVYSSQFPFSTALIVDSGKIAWIGDDAGLAGQLLDGDRMIDCEGSLITPPFFDVAMTGLEGVDSSIGAGVVVDDGAGELFVRDSASSFRLVPRDGAPPAVRVDLGESEVTSADAERMLGSASFVVAGHQARPRALRELAAVGVPFAFGSNGRSTSVWEWIARMVYLEPNGLSARAAFNAATRSGWRFAGMPDAGQLSIGSRANFNLWVCDQVEVQVPDERVSAWSTDVRAGTPPLPDLSPGAALPELVGTVLDGEPTMAR